MRLFLSLIFICFSFFGAPSLTHAQNSQSENVITEVQELAKWSESYFAIANDMITLFNNQEINIALAAIETNDLEAMQEASLKYGHNRRLALTRIEKSIDSMPAFPELKTLRELQGRKVEKLARAMKIQLTQLPIMYDELAVASGHLETLLGRLSKGDFSGVVEIGKQQNLALIRFIEAENLQVEAALLALERTNPNYAFQAIVLAQNKIAIEELRMTIITHEIDMTLDERLPYNRSIKTELDIIRKYLPQGRAALKKMVSQIEDVMPQAKSAQEKQFFTALTEALSVFSDSFEIEEKMFDMALKSYELYSSDKSSWAIDDSIIANDEIITALALERSSLMDQRVALLKQ